mmetsp:Transcript_14266/g.25562  ORF Transcript_14266/g.25562 Transcript_14266/m.25562 type:complete len:261 (+) Transcript_14266:139-921(+)|eukprot:CAMPEP_0184542428 /NCGR_PEP_ID=MMETSP0199_2-20130426/2035_1 /TAXON_ID=1112570 /ORGANISM="Thraustochytrium sp., Strain LLF1b" /LENGTH=260 /DNA_ID=CAMNT_0026936225 /DNA_START=111 /DNA_END=893 /DNA_ORIENTATION=+
MRGLALGSARMAHRWAGMRSTARLVARHSEPCAAGLAVRGFRATRPVMEVLQVPVPPMGEAVTQGDVVEWLKKEGDAVKEDEVICVLETDKVTVDITAPKSGVLTSCKAKVEEVVQTGQIVAEIDTEATAEPGAAASQSQAEATSPDSSSDTTATAPSTTEAASHEYHLKPPRVPSISFRYGLNKKNTQEAPKVAAQAPQKAAPSSSAPPPPTKETPKQAPVPAGVGATVEYVDLPAHYGRLPPPSEDEIDRLNLGGADP